MSHSEAFMYWAHIITFTRRLARALDNQSRADEHRPAAVLLALRGNLDELRHRVAAGDPDAGRWLAGRLAEQNNLDEAIAVMRPLADAGRADDIRLLARLLAKQGNLDEAIVVISPLARTGDEPSIRQLDGLLTERGNLKENEPPPEPS